MSALWCWVWLVALLCARAEAKVFGSSAWACAVRHPHGSSESLSSEEEEYSPQCACLRISNAASSALPGMKLDCSHKEFEEFAQGQKLPNNIRSLDLSGNHFSFLKRGLFDRFRPIEELIFSHNNLVKIVEHALEGLTNLIVLNLSHNSLSVVTEENFRNLPALRRLDLSWNYLEALPPDLFGNMSYLDSLSISGNVKIAQYICESPEALKYILKRGLRRLEMNHLGLTSLPANLFNEAYNLQELYIAHNGFTRLPPLYIGSLNVLNISFSNISVLEAGGFLTVPNLKEIHMNRMKYLTDVEEGAFIGLKYLQVLSLERCHNLTSFDGMAFGVPSADVPPLRILSLKHSGLHNLSKKLLPVLRKIENLKLQGNPWNCDCKLKWIKEINFTKENDHHIRCFFPDRLHNKTISSLKSSDFVCMTKHGRLLQGLVITMGVLFALIALLVIGAFGDSLRRKYCVYGRSTQRIRYDPMVVQLHPNGVGTNWEDTDGHHSISFIRGNRAL